MSRVEFVPMMDGFEPVLMSTGVKNELVRDQGVAVSVSKAETTPPTPFSRPTLPAHDAPPKRKPASTPGNASRLATLMGVTVPTSMEQGILGIAAQTEQFKHVMIELTQRTSQKAMEACTSLDEKRDAKIKEVEKNLESVYSTNFYANLATCVVSSTQIVLGGVVFHTPGFETLGLGMIATGAAGVSSQVLNALGINPTITGAVSLIASAIGFSLGTVSYGIVQPSLAKSVMHITSTVKVLINFFEKAQNGYSSIERGKLKQDEEVYRGNSEAKQRKAQSSMKKLATVAGLGKVAHDAMTKFIADEARIRKEVARQVASAA